MREVNLQTDTKRLEPCEDAVSRKYLLDAFGLSEKTRKYGGDHSGYDTRMLYEIQDVIEDAPSVTPKPQWIPCSECLPEEDGLYLVTTGKGQVQMHVFSHYGNSEEYWTRCNKAWQPLPAPYKEDHT